jgi:hypothetical protein
MLRCLSSQVAWTTCSRMIASGRADSRSGAARVALVRLFAEWAATKGKLAGFASFLYTDQVCDACADAN